MSKKNSVIAAVATTADPLPTQNDVHGMRRIVCWMLMDDMVTRNNIYQQKKERMFEAFRIVTFHRLCFCWM
jgi:hypothetical protein